MCEEKNDIEVRKTRTGIPRVRYLSKGGKKVFIFNEYNNSHWQVVGKVPLNVARKIYLSSLSKYVWIEGKEADLNPDDYATILDEQFEIICKNSGKKSFSVTDFVLFFKNSGFPRFIKSYEIFSKFDLKLFIKFLKDNDLVD